MPRVVRWLSSLVLIAAACGGTAPTAGPAGPPRPDRAMVSPIPCMARRISRVDVHGASLDSVPQLAVLEGTFDDPDRTNRVADLALQGLIARGFATAALSVGHRAGCGVELDVVVTLGPRFHIASIGFEDGGEAGDAEIDRLAALEDALGTVNAVGGVYVAYRMTRALAALERRYRAAGWRDARFGPPRAAYDASGAIAIRIPAALGRRAPLTTAEAR